LVPVLPMQSCLHRPLHRETISMLYCRREVESENCYPRVLLEPVLFKTRDNPRLCIVADLIVVKRVDSSSDVAVACRY